MNMNKKSEVLFSPHYIFPPISSVSNWITLVSGIQDRILKAKKTAIATKGSSPALIGLSVNQVEGGMRYSGW
jgi:hypothetical protein